MSVKLSRRKKIFANDLHKQIFVMVFLSALIPTIIVSVCMFYLIFNITAAQFGIPEAIAYNIIPAAKKVTAIILITAPIVILVILGFAYKITHSIVGPFDRIIRELNECLEGKKEACIAVRKTDKFRPLVERLNNLLDKLKKS